MKKMKIKSLIILVISIFPHLISCKEDDWKVVKEVTDNIESYVPRIRFEGEIKFCNFYFLTQKLHANLQGSQIYKFTNLTFFEPINKRRFKMLTHYKWLWNNVPVANNFYMETPVYGNNEHDKSSCSILVTDHETVQLEDMISKIKGFWKAIGKSDRRLHIHFEAYNR